MKKLYQVAETLEQKTNHSAKRLFVWLNTIGWIVLALCLSVMGCLFFCGGLHGKEMLILTMIGYAGVILGYFGGILYVYKTA